jgi:aminopeptidase-like protein
MATAPKNRTLGLGNLPAVDDLPGDLGESMYSLIKDLYPICRSITGNGVRESLKIVSNIVDLSVTEVPTGTRVFDWEVPLEWNISDAYIENSNGDRVVDFNDSNLHVVSYSMPVDSRLTSTRRLTSPTGSLTEPRTTTRTGDSAWRIVFSRL